MARLSPFRTGLALFVIFAFTSADDKCRSGCQGITPNYFKYAEGTTYKYNLESNVDITLSSAEGQQSTTKLKATVLLTQQPQCNQVIRLQNVQVVGSDGKKHGSIPNLDKPIRINFHDGHVEDVICTEVGDTQNSLNIKRAVASLFQAAMKHHHETDIFGVCPTDFHTHKDGNVMTITKSRHLNRCSHRENVKHDFMATSFNLHSEIKSSPLLKSDYTAEQRIKDGVVDHVLVTENYQYMPFSVGKNGAKATVQTKLQFTGKSKENPKIKCSEPKSIIFENPHPTIAEKCDVATILQAIKDTANSISITVGDNTAGKFSQLLKILEGAKKDDLLAVYNQVKSGAGFNDKTIAKRVFLDALFRTGTGECVEVAIELLKNKKELSNAEQKLVYLSMAFVRHATPSSLATASALLDLPNVPREAYLGIGTLAGRYCKTHDCKNVDELNKLTQKLAGKLKDGKPANRQQEDETVAVLKALANMKHLVDSVIPKIVAIAQDRKAPVRVRVAALETYLSDACKDKLRDSAIGILKDIQQDSEIRIKAYLALAQCPNGKVATVIKNVLDNEPSYQVGGFIVSHIRNLRASANPDKELAKRELSNINTMKRFPIDPRKYSYNDEFSYAFDTLGMSSAAENNVIYSQNSYMPRSACLNLTTEIFGHKFNFLEIDARQENLDKVVEHYFGPLGYLRNKEADELVSSGKASVEKIMSHLKERYAKTRGKRNIPKAELDAMAKQVQIKSQDFNNDLDLDLSVKMFGGEFLFLSLNDNTEQFSAEMVIDKIFDALDNGIEKLKNFEHTFQNNMVFMDAELGYPTSMGFPLKLSVEATSSTQIKTAGSFDIRALLNGNKDTLMKLKLIPSANVEIAGRLIIDAGIMESGLKVVSNLYTATGGALEVEFFNSGNGVDVKFSIPLEKQQLIQAKHDIVFTCRENGQAEHDQTLKFIESKDFSICFDQLSPIIGLTVCAELNTPNYQLNQGPYLPFPLNGHSKVGVWIEREKPLTYHIKDVVFTDPNNLGFQFVMETIGDQQPVSLLIEGHAMPEKYIKATLNTPIKKATLEGRLIDTDKEKSVSALFQHDNEEYSAKFGIGISGNAAKATYTPLIEYKTPAHGVQKSPYTVEGSIIAENNGDKTTYNFKDLKLVAPNRQPITIVGFMSRDKGAYGWDITVGDGTHQGITKGNLQASAEAITVDILMKNSMSPISNFHVDYKFTRKGDTYNSLLTFIHGGELNNPQNKLTVDSKFIHKSKNPQDYHYETKNKFSYPLLGIEGEFDFNKQPKLLEYDVEGKYNNIKLGSEMKLNYNKKTPGDYDFKFEAEALENKIKADAKREINGDVSKIENSLEINGKKVEMNGVVTHKVKPNDVQVGAQITLKGTQMPEPLTVDQSLAYIPHELKTHLKVSKPSNTYIDFDLKASKTAGANGHLKANIPQVFVANGEISAANWNGKSWIVFELLKIQKKVKFDSTFQLSAPTYNVAVSFYPNFEKDPKKITITSNNQIQENSFDSKNEIDAFGQKLEANVKGTKEGNIHMDGKLNGEIELLLPNEMYFNGKIDREIHIIDGVANGKAVVVLEQRDNKNAHPRKISLQGTGKNVDMKNHVFDLTYNLALDDSNGKTFNTDVNIKRSIQGEDKCLDLNGKLSGSVLPKPIELEHSSKYKEMAGTYNAKITQGDNKLNLDGKYDTSSKDKPMTGSINLDVKTTNPKLKTLQFASSASVFRNGENLDMSGNTKLFIDDDGSNPDATVDISADGDVKLGHHNGQLKGTLKFQKMDPISVAVGYSHKEENEVSKCHCDVSVSYAKGKVVRGDVSIVHPNKNEWKIDSKLETPFENAKVTQIQHHVLKSEDSKQVQSDLVITVDSKKYTLNKKFVISDTAPLFKVELTHPDGKVDRLYAKVINSGSKQFAAETSIAYAEKDFSFDGSVDAHLQSIEDFTMTIKVDSPKMKLDKIVLEAKNKQNKAAKVIELQCTSNGANLLKGSTTYKTREEGGKYIAEGSGEFTVKDAKKTGNFKFIKQTLHQEKNGENGVAITFDAGLGSKAVDAELKITNKQFRLLHSYCEAKEQCSHFEIDSKTNVVDVTEYNHELEVNIDLRKLGLLHEFGLKAVTNRKQFVLDHTVDVHFQSQENNKYQYSLYLHPTEAGVSLTTPKRQVALEGKLALPKQGKGPMKGELAMYLNKKAEPNKKTYISGLLEHTETDKVHGVKSVWKFNTPGLAKDLSVTYNGKTNLNTYESDFDLALDVFNKPNNKIVINGKYTAKNVDSGIFTEENRLTLKSAGMNIDISYEESTTIDYKNYKLKNVAKSHMNIDNAKCSSGWLLDVSPNKYHTMFKLFDNELFNIESDMKLSKEAQIIDTNARFFKLKPVTSHFELKNFNTLKYTLAYKENPGKQLVINSAFIPGQIADFRVEVAKNELVKASVQLDEANFLKPEFGLNTDNIQHKLLDPMQGEMSKMLKEGKEFASHSANHATEVVKNAKNIGMKNLPNLKPALDYQTNELAKLKEEIVADKTIKEISELLKNIFGAAAKAVAEILTKINELNMKFVDAARANFARLSEFMEKSFIPKLSEILNNILKVTHDISENITKIIFTVFGKIKTFLDAHQAEFKQIATSLSEVAQDAGRFLFMNYERARDLIVENMRRIYEEIKALPLYDELKMRYEMLLKDFGGAYEPIMNVIKDTLSTLKDVIPNEDIKKLISAVQAHMRNEKVDFMAVLQEVTRNLVKKFQSMISTKNIGMVDPSVFSVNYMNALPKLVAAKFSPLSFLLQDNINQGTVEETLYGFSFNPRAWLPPYRMYAFLVQGQHVFTFDGKHITFPGKCNYLLARDAVNGNFTVAGTYANGLLTAITVAHKDNAVTIKKGGQAMLNKDAKDFPIRVPQLEAFRLYNSVNIVSQAGVKVTCDPQLLACTFSVSGFYHGQLRGLLGNGNYEPYDDFTLPNGKIVTSESDFGNAYKMAAGCPAIKVVDHSNHNHAASCSELFSSTSQMRLCYPFVNIKNFRMACDHGVAAGVKDTEKAVAMGYVAACNEKFIPIRLPEEYLKCENSGTPMSIGTKFSVKLPSKAVDVVIVVEQTKSNEPVYKELVQPMVNELTKELGAKGINDVEFHLIGFGGEYQKYPSHFTNGGKMSWNGKLPTMKFTEEPKETPIDIGSPKLNAFLTTIRDVAHDLSLAAGCHITGKTFVESVRYPFRVHASKMLIAFNGDACEHGKFYPLQKLRSIMAQDKTILKNIVTPVREFKVKDAKVTKNVIGFNSENVFTFSDAKKKPDGSHDLYKDLEYHDYCAEYVLKSGGNVFVTDNFHHAKGAAKKQFVSVLTHNLVDQIVSHEQGLDCECKYSGTMNAVNKCKIAYSKEVKAH